LAVVGHSPLLDSNPWYYGKSHIKIPVLGRLVPNMMRVRTMRFSQDWRKLDDRVFTTIRLHKGDPKYVPGEEVMVAGPTKRLNARVVFACDWKLGRLPISFLEYDLEARPGEKRQDLLNKLGKLYGWLDPPDDDDNVTIYLLARE
jgi:hypothetical protein